MSDPETPAKPKMDENTARVILDAYKQVGGGKLTVANAERVIRAWLRSKSHMVEDRFGNFLPDPKHRYHFKERVFRKEFKNTNGDWSGISSTPTIDVAQNLVVNASVALGDTVVAQKARRVRDERSSASNKRATKAELALVARGDAARATKIVAQQLPDLFSLWKDEGKIPDADWDRLNKAAQGIWERVKSERGLGHLIEDGEIVTASTPPVAVFFSGSRTGDLDPKDVSYLWTENEGGVEYTVTFRPAERRGEVDVAIGATTEGIFGMSVRASTMHVDFDMVDRKGDGFLTGVIGRSKGGKMAAKVFLITSRQKQKGAGTRLLTLWCKMMRGYGIEHWVAEAVGDEGALYLKALERRGMIKIHGSHGANVLVSCT